MSGDYSRQRIAPGKDYSGVFSQQGRVSLDADWNELVDILERRHRAETVDTVGRAAVPRDLPDGFRIALGAGGPTIGPGRIYVDGLLAENHGQPPAGQTDLDFDPVLAELRGSEPIPYDKQPYLKNVAAEAPFPTTGGPHLVYLDVWPREVTYLEDPDLVENAVGVDTTTRSQTAWQVRVLQNVGDVDCVSPDGDLQGWPDLTAPSAGRLSTAAVGVAEEEDLCLTPPSGGYKGLENQLYRVEIHDGGPRNVATFKWSRDNASVATAVTAIRAGNELTVATTKWDNLLGFHAGDWIEITDDWNELAGRPGVMARIQDVDDDARLITLDRALPAATFPVDATNATDPDRHTRIRRWDQQGKVNDDSGQLFFDLDATPPTPPPGVIPVPPAGTPLLLENGVQVTFSLAAVGGEFHTGDYWTFAARTADASVEELVEAPPRGVHHHYCRLALVTLPSDVRDCRPIWPPEVTGAGCDCTACASPESHNSGVFTIQRAVDEVKTVGGKVCLAPGDYVLREPLRIVEARSLLVQGKGWLTRLAYAGDGPAIVVEGATGVTLEAFMLTASAFGGVPASVLVRNAVAMTIQRCVLMQTQDRLGEGERSNGPGAVIGLSGITAATVIRENVVVGAVGIASVPDENSEVDRLIAAELIVEDNLLQCTFEGISLGGTTLFVAETRIAGNAVNRCRDWGVSVNGAVAHRGAALSWQGASHVEIRGNSIGPSLSGIIVGVSDTRILDNDIGRPIDAEGELELELDGRDGIVIVPNSFERDIERCQIIGNRISGLAGAGIIGITRLRSSMIKQNMIQHIGGNGIDLERASAEHLSIENNQLLDIARNDSTEDRFVAGIVLTNANDLAVVGNSVTEVGRVAAENVSTVGIAVLGALAARITGNTVVDIGPGSAEGRGVGIALVAVGEAVDVLDNVVQRRRLLPDGAVLATATWRALLIHAFDADVRIADTVATIGVALSSLGIRIIPGAGPLGTAMLTRRAAFSHTVETALVAVRGNLLDTYGLTETATIRSGGSCIFSENRCLSRSEFSDRVRIVTIFARSVVASHNVIAGIGGAMGLAIATGESAETGATATVVGNIARGMRIELNGVSLPDPWKPLNIFQP